MSNAASQTEIHWLLNEHLPALRARVEFGLNAALQLGEACPSLLRESMHYSVAAGGKRLRPVLVLLACQACGGDVESALPAAVAIELIHTYSLIHDDLPAMDDDELRRGQLTNHMKFGEATAILAGDGLLTLAFEVLAGLQTTPDIAVACIRELSSAAGAEGMVGGQQADLEGETSGITSADHLESIHRRKTGRLISAALRMGGRIAGTTEARLAALARYGDDIGLAFQIADDLLDLSSTPEMLGKGVQKDADRNKLTYPGLLGIDESRRRAVALTEDAVSSLRSVDIESRGLEALARYVVERDR
ncbi:MAG TPA: farnesyl diphosphate synthase [Caulifigura sp.]|nr:farnesyl diphosphate synthase [Caulifigura sp.]